MNRQEIVRKVAQKLQIDEETVDAVYMHQTEAVSKNLKHPDRNLIFFPELGSLNFKVSKAADKLHKYVGKLRRWKAKWDTLEEGKTKRAFAVRINTISELATVLKYKVSYVEDKYGGIRMDFINRSLKFYSGGIFVDFVENLRKERKNGFHTEIIPEPEEVMGKQAGNPESLSELLPVPDEGKERDSKIPYLNMQKKYLRSLRPEGDL